MARTQGALVANTQELHPTSAGGAYVNFLRDEGQERARAAYRDNDDRLTHDKHCYDPQNTLHIHHHIQPAGGWQPGGSRVAVG